MPFKDESWNAPPHDAKHGIKVVMKNGVCRYDWYRTKGERNREYNKLKKRVANPKFNESDVTKAERTI